MELDDRYRIERTLGEGGAGVVYLAHDLRTDRPVALKVVHPDASHVNAAERFDRECRILARAAHPAIMPILEWGRLTDGSLFYAMPFHEGAATLAELIDAGIQRAGFDPARPRTGLRILADLAGALDHLHHAGVTHRDVTPMNGLVTPDGRGLLIDFGLVRTESSNLTRTGTVQGTLAYLSPEEYLASDATPKSDLYQLALIAYEVVVGRRPPAETAEYLSALSIGRAPVRTPERARPGVGPGLARVLMKGLSLDAAQRYESGAAMIAALEEIPAAEWPGEAAPRASGQLAPPSITPAGTAVLPAGPRSSPPSRPATTNVPKTSSSGGSSGSAAPAGTRRAWWAGGLAIGMLAGGAVAYRSAQQPPSPPSPRPTVTAAASPVGAPPRLEDVIVALLRFDTLANRYRTEARWVESKVDGISIGDRVLANRSHVRALMIGMLTEVRQAVEQLRRRRMRGAPWCLVMMQMVELAGMMSRFDARDDPPVSNAAMDLARACRFEEPDPFEWLLDERVARLFAPRQSHTNERLEQEVGQIVAALGSTPDVEWRDPRLAPYFRLRFLSLQFFFAARGKFGAAPGPVAQKLIVRTLGEAERLAMLLEKQPMDEMNRWFVNSGLTHTRGLARSLEGLELPADDRAAVERVLRTMAPLEARELEARARAAQSPSPSR